jgi:hypothetical protein
MQLKEGIFDIFLFGVFHAENGNFLRESEIPLQISSNLLIVYRLQVSLWHLEAGSFNKLELGFSFKIEERRKSHK